MTSPRNRPSILFLIGSMREGGAEGQVVHLMRGLRERGWRVGLMLLHYEGARLAEVEDDGFDVYPVCLPRFRPRWNPLPWIQLAGCYFRSRSYIRSFRPGIFHCWLFWAHLWGRLIVPGKTRFITSRRQMFSDKGKAGILTTVENWINRRADLIIGNSTAVLESVGENEANLDGKLALVYNGIDVSAIDRCGSVDLRKKFPPLADADLIGVTVANLMAYKGYTTLLKAIARLRRRHGVVKFLFIGSGPMEKELRFRAHRLGISDSVVFAGTRRNVPAYIKGADFAVHPSHDEGFSNAILEYMACGKPIVATDVGGTREALAGGRAGLLVPPGKASLLKQKISIIIKDEKTRSALGREAYIRVRREYSLEQMIDKHVDLYSQLAVGD